MVHSSASCGITVAYGPRETSRAARERLESPVARILLGNYEVIGKVPKRGTRLGVLHLITSNKRSSLPLFFSLPPLPLFYSFPLTVRSSRRTIRDSLSGPIRPRDLKRSYSCHVKAID